MTPDWIQAFATITAALIAAATSVYIQIRAARHTAAPPADVPATPIAASTGPRPPAERSSRGRTVVVASVVALATAAATYGLVQVFQRNAGKPDIWLADTSCAYTVGIGPEEYKLVVQFRLGTTGSVTVADFQQRLLAKVLGDGVYISEVNWANDEVPGKPGLYTASALFHSDAAGRPLVVTLRADPEHAIAESNEGNNDVRLRLQLPTDLRANLSGTMSAICT